MRDYFNGECAKRAPLRKSGGFAHGPGVNPSCWNGHGPAPDQGGRYRTPLTTRPVLGPSRVIYRFPAARTEFNGSMPFWNCFGDFPPNALHSKAGDASNSDMCNGSEMQDCRRNQPKKLTRLLGPASNQTVTRTQHPNTAAISASFCATLRGMVARVMPDTPEGHNCSRGSEACLRTERHYPQPSGSRLRTRYVSI